VRGWAVLISLLGVGLGETIGGERAPDLDDAVARLGPEPYLGWQGERSGRPLLPVPYGPLAVRASAAGAHAYPALAPSPYELAPDLAPSPYDSITWLAPDPYRDVQAVPPAPAFASAPYGRLEVQRSVGGARPHPALAPSPYEPRPPELAPSPY
jgi:hypothetical protein